MRTHGTRWLCKSNRQSANPAMCWLSLCWNNARGVAAGPAAAAAGRSWLLAAPTSCSLLNSQRCLWVLEPKFIMLGCHAFAVVQINGSNKPQGVPRNAQCARACARAPSSSKRCEHPNPAHSFCSTHRLGCHRLKAPTCHISHSYHGPEQRGSAPSLSPPPTCAPQMHTC